MKCSAKCIYYTQPIENVDYNIDKNGVKHVVDSQKVYCQYKNKDINPHCKCRNKLTYDMAKKIRKELIENGE